ncbi:MAG TPA: hypothetical protein VG269_19915 [Tepidisphaeraceae bacterium]|nr:hypothetical protein [Tepidisphaeraceae bacterium]
MNDQPRPADNAKDKAEDQPKDENAARIEFFDPNEFFVNHWRGVLLFGIWLLLMGPLVTFPGGNPRQLWWVCAGVCLAANFFIWLGFKWQITKMLSPDDTAVVTPFSTSPPDTQPAAAPATSAGNLLIPAHEPDPPTLRKLLGSNAELAAELTDPNYAGIKIFLGDTVCFTRKEYQSIIRIAGEHLLAIHHTPNGIAVDATIFGSNHNIVAKVIKNRFYINSNNIFRLETPDSHTLIVYDQQDKEALNIRYLNRSSVQVRGIFRHPDSLNEFFIGDDWVSLGNNNRIRFGLMAGPGGSVFAADDPASPPGQTDPSPTTLPSPTSAPATQSAEKPTASLNASASAIKECVTAYVSLLDWLESGSRKSVDSIRFMAVRCPELILYAPMKQGAYVDKVTAIQESARQRGLRPDWTKIKTKVHSDPELIAVMQELQAFTAATPAAMGRIVSLGQSLCASIASFGWGGNDAIDPFLELEAAITAGKSGEDLWAAIGEARKQAKRFQFSATTA